jgi:hypothetical protein
MKIAKIKLRTSNLDRIVDYLIKNLQFDYENHSIDMSILASEDFYFRNISSQLNMIIAKKEKSHIIIEIMGAAGGAGLLNINWWSEQEYTNKVKKILQQYADEFNLTLKEIESS